ncbi:hypothetical protein NCCP2222_23810 [Sporosarcina sp. NCCP-2222]|uniref:hypothetical protein n=1 Tax=Sporosarcina sp. NCCP-2222 TaxID=2935073 RepID=UPI00208A8A47|nr:hypothetical protein [Sporosarcina sp. NCCP-2222]GKV56434.1 hypothetical protein NCCP2222_23810 [Sporosarcina sp. NCCP-2222]
MFAVHFYENKTYVLNQALRNLPAVDEEIRIKGRKGKVVSVEAMEENKYFVYVEFEKIVAKKADALDPKKRKR